MRYWQPMHELSICQALIGQVADLARDRHAQSVSNIFVSVGPLSGVESALLHNAFPLAAAGTVAECAELHIDMSEISVYCDRCNVESNVVANRLLCSKCGGWQTRLVSGDELLLVRVELEMDEHTPLPEKTGVGELDMRG